MTSERDYLRLTQMNKIRISKDDYIEYKYKIDARKIVARAVKLGEIEKPCACDLCETQDEVEAHHVDYGRPLDVIWLCEVCHGLAHRKNHPLNPKNYTQTRHYTEWRGNEYVPVTVNLPVENFIAIKKEAEEKGIAFSRLLRGAILEAYPVEDDQLNFSFMEELRNGRKKNNVVRSKAVPRVCGLASDQESSKEPEYSIVSSLWRQRGEDLSRMGARFSSVLGGHGPDSRQSIRR